MIKTIAKITLMVLGLMIASYLFLWIMIIPTFILGLFLGMITPELFAFCILAIQKSVYLGVHYRQEAFILHLIAVVHGLIYDFKYGLDTYLTDNQRLDIILREENNKKLSIQQKEIEQRKNEKWIREQFFSSN